MSQAIHQVLAALHDSVMVLAPRGWVRVELTVARRGEGLALASLSSKGEGSLAPQEKPRLYLEPKDEAQRAGEALSELARLVPRWAPGTLVFEATPHGVDVQARNADGAVASFQRLPTALVDSLVFTPALFDAVRGTERAFEGLQQRFESRLGRTVAFSYEPDAAILTLARPGGERLRLPALVAGQYLGPDFSWVWGWAAEDALPESTGPIRRVCAPDDKPKGLAALWRPHLYCDEGVAWALAGHVLVAVGGRGLYRGAPSDTEAVYFVVMGDPPPAPQA